MDKKLTLSDAVKGFESDSYAILYSPKKCYLSKFNGKEFVDENGEINVEKEKIYEARVFNTEKELRWVLGCQDKVIIADSDFPNSIRLDQNYLLWGKKNGNASNGWTQFAEARIGVFYVPKEINTDYAKFTAVEYLKEFADGNVAVFEERLTGIQSYQPNNGGNQDADK